MYKPSDVLVEESASKLRGLALDEKQPEMVRCAAIDRFMTLDGTQYDQRSELLATLEDPAGLATGMLRITIDQWLTDLRIMALDSRAAELWRRSAGPERSSGIHTRDAKARGMNKGDSVFSSSETDHRKEDSVLADWHAGLPD